MDRDWKPEASLDPSKRPKVSSGDWVKVPLGSYDSNGREVSI